MADKVEYSRLRIKRSDFTGTQPTIPTGSTLATFIDTDTFVGEFFLNTTDDRLWIRTDNGQIEIPLSGGTGFTESLSQTLSNGNTTGGNSIYMSQDDRIYSFSGNSYIELNKIGDELVKLYSSNGTSYGDVNVNPLDSSITYDDGINYFGSLGIDDTLLRLTYTDTSGGTTSFLDIDGSKITIDTLNVFVNNLPTSSSGLTSNQLYTQTSTELGGSGSTKVICIV